MSNTYFQFKHFTIEQDTVAMKVSTDGVLLGAWANAANAKNILDIGTGTGLLALILAQRHPAYIDAIEIEPLAVEKARNNVNKSPWHERINIIEKDIRLYTRNTTKRYDYIICNPPFFENSKQSAKRNRTLARHNTELNFSQLLQSVSKLLHKNGLFSVIIPAENELNFQNRALLQHLYCRRKTRVISKAGKNPKRILMELCKKKLPCVTGQLFIKDSNNRYTEEYINLTNDYYLYF